MTDLYQNRNEDSLSVLRIGKGFQTIQVISGTNRVKSYTVEKTHRSWGGVERIIQTHGFYLVPSDA